MDLIFTGVLVGVIGTLAMDLLNHLFARTGALLRIDVGMIGRMSAGWARGRFFYSHPSEMKPVKCFRLTKPPVTPSAWHGLSQLICI